MTTASPLHLLALPTPFPIGPVNAYLAVGNPLTLIDTGPKADISQAALESGLATLGYRVEDLRRIVVTHHHVDHMGLAAQIQARSGAEIWTHPYNLPWLADDPKFREQNQPFYSQIWTESGVPSEIIAQMTAANQGMRQWMDPVLARHTLDEGQTIELGNDQWQVFHTPGHAGGLICLWHAASRTLLANDHFLADISSNPVLEPPLVPGTPRPHRLVEYLHHMRRMAALAPEVALPGHGQPVTDVAGLVTHRVAFHERRAQRLLESLNGRAFSLWELTRLTFPRVQRGIDHFLALSEVLAHLDLLAAEGCAQAEQRAAGVVWRAA